MKFVRDIDRSLQFQLIFPEPGFVEVFKDRVNSDSGIRALEIADKLSDMILFHAKVRRNGLKMMQPIEEDW